MTYARETADQPGRTAPAGIDTSVPHPARVWNYWLGGKDHYRADRIVGEQILISDPDLAVIARADREFLGRAVRYLVGVAGIRQFLDIGTGIPTANNTHQVAQALAPESRIVYVDNDPIVLTHALALLASSLQGSTDYVHADLRHPDKILEAAARTLDFHEPVAITLLAVLEFVTDNDQACGIIRRLLDAVPPGSYLVISQPIHSVSMDQAARHWNESGATPVVIRSPAEVARFFEGLEILEPGIVPLPQWRPDPDTRYTKREVSYVGGVGRKP